MDTEREKVLRSGGDTWEEWSDMSEELFEEIDDLRFKISMYESGDKTFLMGQNLQLRERIRLLRNTVSQILSQGSFVAMKALNQDDFMNNDPRPLRGGVTTQDLIDVANKRTEKE